jgi:PKD repeat protein
MILKGNATGIIEGGYIDSKSDYTIRALDNSQAKICGTLSVRDEYFFHSNDENRVCVSSICPDDIRGISGSGGGFCSAAPVAPVADFTSDTRSIYVGDTINFSDLSTNNPTSWSWAFEGGTPPSSNEPSPSVKYDSAGTFIVTLTVSNTLGSSTETKTAYVNVADSEVNAVDVNKELKDAVQVYPNPASDKLYITNLPEDATISVFNCYGQQIIITSNKTYLNIDSLENGIYILNVNSGESRQVLRFIKI